MKLPALCLIGGLLTSACDRSTVKEDLGIGFEISGDRDRGIFTIKQDGTDVARIDLNKEFLDYSAHSKDRTYAGHLSTPTDSRSGRGCSATIVIPSPDGGKEEHQLTERRLLADPPVAHAIARGGADYFFEPSNKKGEDATPPAGATLSK